MAKNPLKSSAGTKSGRLQKSGAGAQGSPSNSAFDTDLFGITEKQHDERYKHLHERLQKIEGCYTKKEDLAHYSSKDWVWGRALIIVTAIGALYAFVTPALINDKINAVNGTLQEIKALLGAPKSQ